jgi:hypothetical protein
MYHHALSRQATVVLLLALLLLGCSTQSVTPVLEATPVSNGTYTIAVSSQTDRAPTWSKPAEPDKIYLGVCVSSLSSPDGSVELKDSDGNAYSPQPLPLRYEKEGKQVLCRWFYVPLAAKGFTFKFADFPPVKLNY